MTDRYRHTSDLPEAIPVFPLRGVILLPGASLPLNVFEPRYLEMLDAVMSGDRILGILQPDIPEKTESPKGKNVPLKHTGGAGRVTAYQELDDGRIAITLTGVARFTVVEEIAGDLPYRVCTVSYEAFAADLSRGQGEGDVDRDLLLNVLKAYLEANGLQTDWKAIERASTEYLVNSLSVVSPYGPEEKQALLEAADLKTRAEVLIALAEMEIASRDDGSGSTMQ